jgi:hypothetical protein
MGRGLHGKEKALPSLKGEGKQREASQACVDRPLNMVIIHSVGLILRRPQ